MGLLDYVFDTEWSQRHDIERLQSRSAAHINASRRLGRKTMAAEERVKELEGEVGELALICRSLLTALVDSDAIDRDRFFELMHNIDASDGKVDGKFTPADRNSKKATKPKRAQPKMKVKRRPRRK